MREWYELWDTDAGNMVGAYEDVRAALADVRGLLEVNGLGYADALALARRHEAGGDPVAAGTELARLADDSTPERRTA